MAQTHNLWLKYADGTEQHVPHAEIERKDSAPFEYDGRWWRSSYTFVERHPDETQTNWVVCHETAAPERPQPA